LCYGSNKKEIGISFDDQKFLNIGIIWQDCVFFPKAKTGKKEHC
jgi:hypothetical protein